MNSIPTNGRIDSTLALARAGYSFIGNECERLGSDIFSARLLLKPTICMRGPALAKLFYDGTRIQRKGACPMRVIKTLFGKGGIQGLDDVAHRERKTMLMSLMTPNRIEDAADTLRNLLEAAANDWEARERVVVLPEMHRVLCQMTCQWSGVPITKLEANHLGDDLATIVDGAGAVGVRHFRSRRARNLCNRLAGRWIHQVRRGELLPPEHSALMVIATYRSGDNELLSERDAAVELLNILRPSVAVARWVAFAVLALHEHPDTAAKLEEGDRGVAADRFGEEVRRFYPFFPAAVAKTREAFDWNGYRFPSNTRVLLDLYSTNRLDDCWIDADRFRPDRFASDVDREFSFIPHGGGDYHHGHRCAGEPLTRRLLQECVSFFSNRLRYRVPKQDLSISLTRFPAEPASRMIIDHIQRTSAKPNASKVSLASPTSL